MQASYTLDLERMNFPVSVGHKFADPDMTAAGERRASVPLVSLRTLWFNTGTLCNLTCHNCYIESSPKNDRLVYLSRAEVRTFLDEARINHPELQEIGFTGGEPFMNRDLIGMLEDALASQCEVLVLTNGMRPMQHAKAALLRLNNKFPGRLTIRVSLEHYTAEKHEEMRGPRSWQPTLEGLTWLAEHEFKISVAGRLCWSEDEISLREGYRALFSRHGLRLRVEDPDHLVLFPEMDSCGDAPEITERCWAILGTGPDSVMCATSRMVIKRRGVQRPVVVSCTLLPYEEEFEMGATLSEAARPVKLNHRFCAQFCVLGGASCSGRGNQ
jgi:uncharacterized Fe-S cluster-containing radical SAM superfamily protein